MSGAKEIPEGRNAKRQMRKAVIGATTSKKLQTLGGAASGCAVADEVV